jgi:DNA-binding transcriptional regulator LsrR (DeoR family)
MSTSGVQPASIKGPAELVLAASIARRHYMDGRSKVEIADEFQLSRFKVARLLEAARTQGLVRIEIGHAGIIDVDTSGRLADRFGLRHAIVVDTPDNDLVSLRANLGKAAADLLTEIATPTDVVGLAWARSVQAMVAELKRLPAVPVVQLTGALARSNDTSSSIAGDSSVDIVREVARVSGGPAYLYFAPFLVPDPTTARALRKQPELARAFDRFPSVTIAVVGIGRWAPGQSTLYDAAAEREQARLRREGVCAEVAGVFLTADGRVLQTALNDRMIGINGAQLRKVQQLIAIPYEVSKAPAVRAALLSGMVDTLVTHVSLAEALLRDADEPAVDPATGAARPS